MKTPDLAFQRVGVAGFEPTASVTSAELVYEGLRVILPLSVF